MAIQVNIPSGTDVLKQKAMLVKLVRKKLNRNKLDKDLSIELKDNKNIAEAGVLRVNKSLFSKACTEDYMKIYNEASKYFYGVTLPWDEQGYRFLSIEIYEEFTKRMRGYTSQYRDAMNNFIENVQTYVDEARDLLADAFKIDDYKFLAPNGGVDRDWLENQFKLDVEFTTVPTGEDLRVTLTDADREALADQINKSALEKFGKSQEHIVHGLLDCVKAIHERLCDSEHIFRDTLIGNLEDLVDLVPKLNITGDKAINDLAAECKHALCKWDPQTLREDDDKRKEVSDAADKILKQAEGLI